MQMEKLFFLLFKRLIVFKPSDESFKLLLNEFIPKPTPKPTANFPDFERGMSLIKPKLKLVENLFSLKLVNSSPNEL